MATNPESHPDYMLSDVQNIEPEFAEILLKENPENELVSCTPVPGAETMPPNKISLAPQRTVRVYELQDDRPENYVLVTCLLQGGDGPRGILIDRAIVFNGEVGDMLDHLLQTFDEADWSRGIKRIENIRTTGDYEYVAQFLREVSEVLESDSDNRYAMDLWQEYMDEHEGEELPWSNTENAPSM